MLVLSRKPGEQVIINGNIRITVVQTHGGKVKIGIEAPGHVPVMRKELVTSRKGITLPDQAGVRHAEAPGANDPLRSLRKVPR